MLTVPFTAMGGASRDQEALHGAHGCLLFAGVVVGDRMFALILTNEPFYTFFLACSSLPISESDLFNSSKVTSTL